MLTFSFPDGLELPIQNTSGKAEIATFGDIFDTFRSFQNKLSIMPDYALKGTNGWSFIGLLGALLTFVLSAIAAYIISFVKKRKKQNAK